MVTPTNDDINPSTTTTNFNPLNSTTIINPLYDPLKQSIAHKLSMEESINKLINKYTYDKEPDSNTRQSDTHSNIIEPDSYTRQSDTHSNIIEPDSCTRQSDTHSNIIEPDSYTRQSDTYSNTTTKPDTYIFPLIQMAPYNIRQDEQVITKLLSMLNESDRVYLASGYFNLPSQYLSAIINNKGICAVLAASPKVSMCIMVLMDNGVRVCV